MPEWRDPVDPAAAELHAALPETAHRPALAALRISEADQRGRTRGVSHHSLTALGRVALAPADVVVPALPGDFGATVRAAAASLSPPHQLIDVSVDGLREALDASPVAMSTMGRDIDEDAAYFLGCAATGRHAASLLPLLPTQR